MILTFFTLYVGQRRVLLTPGNDVMTDDLAASLPRGQRLARVAANPYQPEILGLQNVSQQSWKVQLPDGGQTTVAPTKTLKLAHSLKIDFGGVSAFVTASVGPPVSTQPAPQVNVADPVFEEPIAPPSAVSQIVQKAQFERLSRTLARAASEGWLTQKQFDKLHANFFGRDANGKAWTFSLKSWRWNCAEFGKWIQGDPPSDLLVAADTLDQLHTLKNPATKRPSR